MVTGSHICGGLLLTYSSKIRTGQRSRFSGVLHIFGRNGCELLDSGFSIASLCITLTELNKLCSICSVFYF